MQGKSSETEQKKQKFSQKLQIMRKKRNLSQDDFAKKIGLTGHAQVSRYESSKSLPDVATLEKIAEVLDVDLHWLITGHPSPDLRILAETLKGPAQQYLSQLSQKIRENRNNLVGYDLHKIFKGEENEDKIRKTQAEIECLQAEYDKLSTILIAALKESKGEKGR